LPCAAGKTTTVPFGGFENTSAGSVVLWSRPEALRLFGDLAKDEAVPEEPADRLIRLADRLTARKVTSR
jgi:hypothetical protein